MNIDDHISEAIHDLSNWKTLDEISELHPQFNRQTLKVLFWKRDEKPGLSLCCNIIGKKMFVNIKLFGLWMSGLLPGQDMVKRLEDAAKTAEELVEKEWLAAEKRVIERLEAESARLGWTQLTVRQKAIEFVREEWGRDKGDELPA